MELTVHLEDIGLDEFQAALHQSLPENWSRDGILEHQITTQDEVQFCVRRRASDEVPRASICLSGTADTLVDAAIVPVDRGPELTDEQQAFLLKEFAQQVVKPALARLAGGTFELSEDSVS